MKNVDVGNDYYFRLANRNKFQGDGKYNAVDFRNLYLKELDSNDAWSDNKSYIRLDFVNVKKIGPSFANEAFAYFMQYTNPENFKKKVIFENLTEVQKLIIDKELNSGYSK